MKNKPQTILHGKFKHSPSFSLHRECAKENGESAEIRASEEVVTSV